MLSTVVGGATNVLARAGASEGGAILMGAAAGVVVTGLLVAEGVHLEKKFVAYRHRKHNEKEVKEIKDLDKIRDETLGELAKKHLQANLPRFHTLAPASGDAKADDPSSYQFLEVSNEFIKETADKEIILEEPDLQLFSFYLTECKKQLYMYDYERWHRLWGLRSTPNDVPSVFLRTTIYMLDSVFSRFQGYEFDLDVLHQTIILIRRFSQLYPGHPDRVDHLHQAAAYLELAELELIEHGKKLTYVDRLNDIYLTARVKNLKLMEFILLLVTHPDDWDYVNRTLISLLKQGKIKPKFAHGLTMHNGEIVIPNSPYKANIMRCAQDYVDSLAAGKEETRLKFEIRADKHSVKPFAPAELTAKRPNFVDRNFSHTPLTRFEQYREFFEKTLNWVTAYVVHTDSRLQDPEKLVPIEDPNEIARRIPFIPALCELSTKLSNFNVDTLVTKVFRNHNGNDYLNNPHFCQFSVKVTAEFGERMSTEIKMLIDTIEKMNTSATGERLQLTEPYATQKEDMLGLLRSTKDEIANKIALLVTVHNKLMEEDNKDKKDPHASVVNVGMNPMLEMKIQMAKAYKLMSSQQIAVGVDTEIKAVQVPLASGAANGVPSATISANNPAATGQSGMRSAVPNNDAKLSSPPTKFFAPVNAKENGQASPPPSFPSSSTITTTISRSSTMPPKTKPTIEALLKRVGDLITFMGNSAQGPLKVDLDDYRELHKLLMDVSAHAVGLQVKKDPALKERGDQLQALTYTLTRYTEMFLKKEINAEVFEHSVADLLAKKKDIIDQPTSVLERMGLSHTDDRLHLIRFENKCVEILNRARPTVSHAM